MSTSRPTTPPASPSPPSSSPPDSPSSHSSSRTSPTSSPSSAAALLTLVNPNLVHPPITPYALDILTSALEADGFHVEVLDLTFRRDDWRSAVRDYFTDRDPLLVGVTIRNTDTIYPQEQRVFLDDHKQIIGEIRRRTAAPIVGGGVGFSSMPYALVDYFGIDYGVKGPGEATLVRLAAALRDGAPTSGVPDLIINNGGGQVRRVSPLAGVISSRPGASARLSPSLRYARRSGAPWRVDNLAYYRRGGLGNILTKNGCPLACTHCVEPDAKGTVVTRRAVDAVVDEMEQLCAQGVHDLHTTDSEFNLHIANSKAVLREIVRRKQSDPGSPLRRLKLWIYTQPSPFDEELMELLAAAGCGGVNLAVDHVRADVLDDWKVTSRGRRFYEHGDAQHVCSWAAERGIPVMIEALLGMPGETESTVRECVKRTLDLDALVVGYTLGIRVFPYSPLGIQLAEQCDGLRTVPGLQSNTAVSPIVLRPLARCAGPVAYERQFMFDGTGRVRPVYYFSPDLPEDPDTIAAPNGRRLNTLRLLWDLVPAADHPKVMLPTVSGITSEDNNYADNPFLLALTQLGYKGAYWRRWREREAIMREATRRGLVANPPHLAAPAPSTDLLGFPGLPPASPPPLSPTAATHRRRVDT